MTRDLAAIVINETMHEENDALRTILCRVAREIDPYSDLGPQSPVERFASLPNDIRQQFRLMHMELAR